MLGEQNGILPKFDVETALKTIDKQKPTLFPGAPTIYIGLLNHPRHCESMIYLRLKHV